MSMKLWILQPVDGRDAPWLAYYDCMFGFVVRAANEDEARSIAASRAGDEGPDAWKLRRNSTCKELKAEGPAGVIMEDANRPK